MPDDIIHQLEEFNNLPWSDLNPSECTMTWSFRIVSSDGYWRERGVRPGQLIIDIIDERDLHSEIWVCPEPLAAVVKMAQHIAAEDVRDEVRQVKHQIEQLMDRREPPCRTGLAAKMM